MKHNVEFKHGVPDRRVRQLVNESIARLEKLWNSRSSNAFLRLFVDRNAARTLYRASVTLALPGRTLAAQEERHDVVEAVVGAFTELKRELQRYKEKLTRSYTYKRPARRRQLRRQKTGAVATTERLPPR